MSSCLPDRKVINVGSLILKLLLFQMQPSPLPRRRGRRRSSSTSCSLLPTLMSSGRSPSTRPGSPRSSRIDSWIPSKRPGNSRYIDRRQSAANDRLQNTPESIFPHESLICCLQENVSIFVFAWAPYWQMEAHTQLIIANVVAN